MAVAVVIVNKKYQQISLHGRNADTHVRMPSERGYNESLTEMVSVRNSNYFSQGLIVVHSTTEIRSLEKRGGMYGCL